MAFTLYNSAVRDFFDGPQDWDTDTHYAILLNDTYVPSLSHSTVADIVSAEVTDLNYNPTDMGGETVTVSGDTIVCDANDVLFGNPVTITSARYVVIAVGTAGTKGNPDLLVGFAPIGNASVSNDEFLVEWDPQGIFRIRRGAEFDLIEPMRIQVTWILSGSGRPVGYEEEIATLDLIEVADTHT